MMEVLGTANTRCMFVSQFLPNYQWRQYPRVTSSKSPSKFYHSVDDAVADIESGSTLLSAGFGLCGTAETIIRAIERRGRHSLHSLTVVSNNIGSAVGGGLSPLVESGQISRAICSFIGNNKTLEQKYFSGEVAVELTPQGTLAEKIRCGGAGIPAFYTPTGVATHIQTGEIPVRYRDGKVVERGLPRETRIFDGRVHNMETAITGDVAILRAWKVDEQGNCKFRYTTKSFGVLMAKAAKLTIVEAEHIVPVGELKPDEIDLPGIFIKRIVRATEQKHIEISKFKEERAAADLDPESEGSLSRQKRNRIARRAAKELRPGSYVNLGIGMPTLAVDFLPPDSKVWIQSENGIMGMGPYPTKDELDGEIINAGKETVTLVSGASTFDSSESFGMIRGGHIDVSMLGALQVGANGDLANYTIPGKVFKGMGGAMDLVSNPDQTRIVVLTNHVDKHGKPKIVQTCSLPLTGAKVVSTIITDLCVFQVDREKGGLTLTELAPGVTIDEVRGKTDADFEVGTILLQME
ncbi:hypothetical protein BX600DRAFT_524809 [Xylariales sp. PMI_506]|nr:hypothetical protein BX600DRAFT_524809 [Xylariales sp. PMI_506]